MCSFWKYVVLFFLFSGTAFAGDYFLDADDGSDLNDGQSSKSAWCSLERASERTYKAGDRLLLRSGQVWQGALLLKGSGIEGKPIVVDRYGDGPLPRIEGDGKSNHNLAGGHPMSCAIRLYNQENWWIQNVEVINYNAEEEDGLSLMEWEQRNIDNYLNVDTPPREEFERIRKVGLLVQAKGANKKGVLSGFRFRNVKIHGINGDMSSKHNGGIFFRIYNDGSDTPMRFDDVRIENCHIYDVDRTGISNVSYFDDRTFDEVNNWTPNRNWMITGNRFERTGANALIVRVAVDPIIENNLFDSCAIKGSGNAAFNFNTDGAVWQYNEFCRTKANEDDEDAGGVDSDYKSKDTLIQFNYSHHNDFGMLVTGGPDAFNDGTVIRDNLFVGDGQKGRKGGEGHFVFRVSGSATNTLFHRNKVIIGEGQKNVKLAFHKRWKTWAADTEYRENTIVNHGVSTIIDLGDSRGNDFSGNQYYGEVVIEPKSNRDVYLLIGQSNMAGRAPILEGNNTPMVGCDLLNHWGRWEAVMNPLNRYSTIRKRLEMQRLGPGYMFAARMVDHFPNRRVGLVVNARGGSKIGEWKKGSLNFEEAVRRVEEASEDGSVLKGIIWHQGEGNSKDPKYLKKLITLVEAFRDVFNDSELPFVAGMVEGDRFVNSEILRLVDELPYCAVASSEGLQTLDGTHFDSESTDEMGVRMANVLYSILSEVD